MSKITVIIPCYNAEKYIERCLMALNNQCYKDFKVIIIDDASQDNTVVKIAEVARKVSFEIDFVYNEKNSGPAFSRNRGICLADSDYLCFCDSDDWFDSNFLASMLKRVEADGSDIAFCGYRIVSSNGDEEERPLCCKHSIVNCEEALGLDLDSLCMMLVKAPIMKSTLLPDIRNGEDMAVVPLLISKANKCSVVSECLYNYYRNTQSASQTANMRVVESLVLSFKHVCENLPSSQRELLEYIGIRNLLYPSIITLFTFTYDIKKAKEIIESFETDFPTWHKNVMIKTLPKYKKLVLFFICKRLFFLIRLVALLRSFMIRK